MIQLLGIILIPSIVVLVVQVKMVMSLEKSIMDSTPMTLSGLEYKCQLTEKGLKQKQLTEELRELK